VRDIVKKIRILVADDHTLVRDGLCQLLETQEDLEVVGRAEDGEVAVRLAKELLPDVAIIDVVMPKMNGIDAAKQIKKVNPTTAILIVSAHKYRHYVLACMKAGVSGYMLKDTPPGELSNAIRMVHAGKGVFDLQATDKMLQDLVANKDKEKLGTRELEVLKLAAKGMGNKEIGNELDISDHTVGSHLVNIFRKLGVQSRTEAILYALKEGWFTVDDLV
jgi:DNA-binding NarL/FixJ family response regulator